MKNWMYHPEIAILDMTKVGDLDAIAGIECICKCISSSLWQQIANIAAQYGHMHIIEWINTRTSVNWQEVAFHARDSGQREIASYADGYDIVLSSDLSYDTDDFPLNLAGPVGDPTEDKGEFIFDWRLQDYKEEFLPEELLYIDDEEEVFETDEYDHSEDLISSDYIE